MRCIGTGSTQGDQDWFVARFASHEARLWHAREPAMKIQVLYFAVFRERLGVETETVELDSGRTVGDLLDQLGSQHDVIERLRGSFRAARNQEMTDDSQVLEDGDELALIPPVAGGSDGLEAATSRRAVVLDEPLSVDRVIRAVSAPDCGGLVVFVGMVRDHSQGKEVVKLEYEAYVEMTEKVFNRLCSEIEADIPTVRLALEHRVGALEIGDYAVVIAAASPHRAEAFRAARALIDRLKEDAPIWKKETDPSGAHWVGLGP